MVTILLAFGSNPSAAFRAGAAPPLVLGAPMGTGPPSRSIPVVPLVAIAASQCQMRRRKSLLG